MSISPPPVTFDPQVFGYHFDLAQLNFKLTFTLPDLADFDVSAAQARVAEAFAEAVPPARIRRLNTVEVTSLQKEYIALCTFLSRQLLTAGSIPLFDEGLVVSLEKNACAASCTILTPIISYLPPTLVQRSFDIAQHILACFCGSLAQGEALERLLEENVADFVSDASAMGHGGYSTKFILKRAFELGIPFQHMGWGIYQLGVGAKSIVLSRSATTRDSALGSWLSQNKSITNRFLLDAGLPVARSLPVASLDAARHAAGQFGWPVVLKPADRDRGEGVTVDISSEAELAEAWETAAKWSQNIILEERIPGICHRIVIFRDQLVFAYSRHPSALKGDGESTIAELHRKRVAADAVKAKPLRKKLAPLDDLARAQLERQEMSPETVLDRDALAYLRPYQSILWGGLDDPVTEKVHPANVDLARRVAKLYHLEMVGVDFIATDVTRPWYETGATIGEVNYRPQVANNTAKAMLEIIFEGDTGEIPVEYFIGDRKAYRAALDRQAELTRDGSAAYLSSHRKCLDPRGEEVRYRNVAGLFDRASLLGTDQEVEALILVVQTDELLYRGLPFPTVTEVTLVNNALSSASKADAPAAPGVADHLYKILSARRG